MLSDATDRPGPHAPVSAPVLPDPGPRPEPPTPRPEPGSPFPEPEPPAPPGPPRHRGAPLGGHDEQRPGRPHGPGLFWARIEPTARTIRLVGEFDLNGTSRVAACAARLGFTTDLMTVNLSRLTFIGADGLNAILDLGHRQRAAGGRMRVVQASAWIARVFGIGGLGELLQA